MEQLFETVVRYVKVLIALAIAVASIWRGNTYLDPKGPGMMVPAMCIVFGMLVACTTFALTLKSQSEASLENA
jgi:hypothetical protein